MPRVRAMDNAEVVGACLSEFHGEPDKFELLLSYSDGKEIGHVISRDAIKRVAAVFVKASYE